MFEAVRTRIFIKYQNKYFSWYLPNCLPIFNFVSVSYILPKKVFNEFFFIPKVTL